MSRTIQLFAIVAFLELTTSLSPIIADSPSPRPNVLFLFTDDQRADTIAALGNPVIRTPHLDRLCRKGITFRRAYMQGGMHGATCVPSRAMLLSGRSLFHVDEKLLRHETWPAAFGKAGYTTFATGKWHNGPASLPHSFQQARSIFAGGMTNPMKAPLAHVENGKLAPPKTSAKHACEVFADEAIAFLKQHKSETPFFLYVAFDGPHDPHIIPDEYPIRYPANAALLPANFMPQHPFNNGEMTIRDEVLLPHPRAAGAVQSMNADYYRYVSYLDTQLGRILEALDATPLAKNTIIVFSSDSGVARGSHGLIGKQNLYEHSIRVPLIFAGPGIAANRSTDAMCYLFDLMPTLGALCGVSPPPPSEGKDLSRILRDASGEGRSALMFAYRDVQRACRNDRWKLIRYPQIDKTQLFDLRSDPDERENLADRPEHASKASELMTLLEKEMKAAGDSAPLTVSNPKPADWSPTPRKKK